MQRRTFFITLLFICYIPVASADNDAEKTALATLIHELTALDGIIAGAEAQANPDNRIQFQYNWLRADLERMKLGIREHLIAPLNQPRSFPPLKGDYRR